MDIIEQRNDDHVPSMGTLELCTYTWRKEFDSLSSVEIFKLLTQPDQVQRSHNTMCYSGLSQLVAAANWSAIEDQNANMGSPFNATYMAPMYGAVGAGSPTPTFGDTSLNTEVARGVVTSAGITQGTSAFNPTVIWLFLLPPPASSHTVTEAGIFLNANSTSGNGLMLDHSVFTGVSWGTTQLLTLSFTFSFGN